MGNLPITLFDIIVLAVVGLSTLSALVRGGVREVFGLGCWLGALVVAYLAYPTVQPMARAAIPHQLAADLAAAVGVFVVAFFVLKIVAATIARVVEASPLGPIDKLVGLLFGFARGALIVCAAYLVFSYLVAPAQHPAWVKQAVLLEPVQQGSALIERYVPASYRDEGLAAVGGAAVDAATRVLDQGLPAGTTAGSGTDATRGGAEPAPVLPPPVLPPSATEPPPPR